MPPAAICGANELDPDCRQTLLFYFVDGPDYNESCIRSSCGANGLDPDCRPFGDGGDAVLVPPAAICGANEFDPDCRSQRTEDNMRCEIAGLLSEVKAEKEARQHVEVHHTYASWQI